MNGYLKKRKSVYALNVKVHTGIEREKMNKANVDTYNKKYRKLYPEKVREANKKWRENNKEKMKLYLTQWRKDNAIYIKEYYKSNITEFQARRIKWKTTGFKQWFKNYYSKPKNKINRRLTSSLWQALRGNKNGHHWEDLVGYTLEDLMAHLESLFKNGMTWDNYGKFGWHIDHIIPQCLWEFETYTDPEFRQCWALSNLQPLWANDNLSKSKRSVI